MDDLYIHIRGVVNYLLQKFPPQFVTNNDSALHNIAQEI